MDLFDHVLQKRMKSETPLAARMRRILRMHRTLDEFARQEEIGGPGKLIRRAINPHI